MTKIIAHRGYSERLIDNSKTAFHEAVTKKFAMIELDIQLSKDNYIFIFHDTFIGRHRLENLNFKEITELNSTIFTLVEFFEIFSKKNIEIYLDIKGNSLSICQELHDVLRSLENLKKIYIASYNFQILEELHHLSNQTQIEYQLGLITENIYSFAMFQKMIELIDMKFISFYWEILEHDIIHFFHQQKVIVFTYTCRNDSEYQFIKNYQVDGIVSNILIPEKMKKN